MTKKIHSLLSVLLASLTMEAQLAAPEHTTATAGADEAVVTLFPEQAYPISPMLYGCFFEDINCSADGGIYAELLQNRDFEYSHYDYASPRPWSHDYAWHIQGDGVGFGIDSLHPIHPNNPHYVVLNIPEAGGTLINDGFDGISLRKGRKYRFSLYLRHSPETSRAANIEVCVRTAEGKVAARAQLKVKPLVRPSNEVNEWRKYDVNMKAVGDCRGAHLELRFPVGRWEMDLLSLFPHDTFKRRANGLRPDLVALIADMHPRFMRFPGGCVAHGDGIDNIYDWKGSVGPLYARRPTRNIGGYHQTRGLGYLEYFTLCEDLGMEPIPVLAAGVSCQNTSHGGPLPDGTFTHGPEAIPMKDMPAYVDDVLHLIEWATAEPRQSAWARLRAEAGHPQPFRLNYLAIGNEDAITPAFKERFIMIYEAVKQRYPRITLIGTAGPDLQGRDFEAGWALADSMGIDMVDEHGYRKAQWFIDNAARYDSYDRHRPTKIYLGEWGTSYWGARMTFNGALAEAIYTTALERNADIVRMASFAPMFAKESQKRWVADMIYFNNDSVMPTASYQVQKMCGQTAGDIYIPSRLSGCLPTDTSRVALSAVFDSPTGMVHVKLVNHTDQALSVRLDPELIRKSKPSATVRCLTASSLNDRDATLVTAQYRASTLGCSVLPPHSFTVMSFRAPNYF